MSVGQDLLNVPFGDMVMSLGNAIASAQSALDLNSIRMAQVMSGSDWIDHDEEGEEVVREGTRILFGGNSLSLLELGFTPTFYQFVDTIIEVKVSISMKKEDSRSKSSTDKKMKAKAGYGWASVSCSASVSTVSANYAAKHSYSAEGASLIRTKLVPIPPPAVFEERVRKMLEDRADKALTLSPELVQLTVGAIQQLTVTNAKGETLTTALSYASSAPAVATVSSGGEVTAIAKGVATIKVSCGGNQGEVKVVVKAAAN